jgi:capsular exopolysaccharide synthesis family protein
MPSGRYPSRYIDDDFEDSYFNGNTAQTGNNRSLKQIFSVLWRRKFRIMAATLSCGLIAYSISYLLTPRYFSEGILAVQTRPIYLPQLGMAAPPPSFDITIPRSEAQVLKSRSLVDKVAHQLHLDRDPDLNPYLASKPFLSRMMAQTRLQFVHLLTALGIASSNAYSADEDTQAWSTVDDNVTQRLDIHTDGKSYVVYVGFDGASPQVSADVVNGLMKQFLTNQIESYSKSFMDANAWIKQRAEELRQEVQEADTKVQEYMSAHSLVATQTGGTVSGQQLADLNTQLSLARADRAQAEARFGQAQQEGQTSGNESSSEVLNSPLIQKLRQREAETMQKQADLATRLGPTHPALVAVKNELANIHSQIQIETQKVMSSLKNQVVISQTREQTLEKQIASLQTTAQQTSNSEVGLNQLQKEADTKRNVYQTFLATAQQTADPERINQANARIVSAAIPPVDPTSPNKKLFAIAGLFVGFLTSGAMVLLLSEMDHGFETAADVESLLGLPVLATVPLVRRRSARRYGLGLELIEGRHSPISETLRGVRVALKSCTDPDALDASQVVLVTSAEPGEGKTSFASAMAAVAAQDGLRVLVVDSDLRRPRFHRMLEAEPGPSLQDVLRGGHTWVEAVRTDPDTGAHCLTAHERTDSPVSLLSSGHWATLLADARKVYDLIILDSPPVIQVADALTLADYADSTIFVIAYKSTPRQTIEEAVRRFGTIRKPITGIALTKVPATTMAQSYYSGYYPA